MRGILILKLVGFLFNGKPGSAGRLCQCSSEAAAVRQQVEAICGPIVEAGTRGCLRGRGSGESHSWHLVKPM